MYDGLIFTPITLFIPFSLKIQGLVQNRKYLLTTLITLVPIAIIYFSNTSSHSLENMIIITFFSTLILFFITIIFIYLLGFLDYHLRTKSTDSNIISSIFYLIYLSYITIIYFTSNRVVDIVYSIINKIF
ncbi:unknown [Mycoplasma sp. CAG:956]|nr:unknown [Mycoplasma sp. CAG:956]